MIFLLPNLAEGGVGEEHTTDKTDKGEDRENNKVSKFSNKIRKHKCKKIQQLNKICRRIQEWSPEALYPCIAGCMGYPNTPVQNVRIQYLTAKGWKQWKTEWMEATTIMERPDG